VKKLYEEYKTDIDHVDNNGQTPIFYAVKTGKMDVINYLLQNGAMPDRIDNKGTTLVQFAKRQQK
jgi:ankyrin repeat protein